MFPLKDLTSRKDSRSPRPESKSLLSSLGILRDFGYHDIWDNEEAFEHSFQLGNRCPKYIQFLDYLEKETDIWCPCAETQLMKALLALLKNSSTFNRMAGCQKNPMDFRFENANRVMRNLIDAYFQDMRNTNSKALHILCGHVVGDPKAARTHRRRRHNQPRRLSKLNKVR